jgi:hypothetical protein
MRLAIPAGLILLLPVIICVTALVAVVSGRGNVRQIRHYSDSLSAGRLLVALKSGIRDFELRSAEWLEVSGRRRVSLAKRAEGDVLSTVDSPLIK